jgi:hypothetical protein
MRLLIASFFRSALLPQVYDLVATLCIADLRKFEMIVHHSLAILLAFFLLRDEYAHYYAVFFLGMTEVRCVLVYTYYCGANTSKVHIYYSTHHMSFMQLKVVSVTLRVCRCSCQYIVDL